MSHVLAHTLFNPRRNIRPKITLEFQPDVESLVSQDRGGGISWQSNQHEHRGDLVEAGTGRLKAVLLQRLLLYPSPATAVPHQAVRAAVGYRNSAAHAARVHCQAARDAALAMAAAVVRLLVQTR